VVVAVGTLTGELIDATEWPAGYRHGETLLPTIADLLERLELTPESVAAIVVGTGPGAFTGLRVGIATAKGMAHALGVPIVGVSTADALLAGADPDAVLLLPAGPADRLVAERGLPARLVPAGEDPGIPSGATLVALDLADRAPVEALERGETARAALGASLIELEAAELLQLRTAASKMQTTKKYASSINKLQASLHEFDEYGGRTHNRAYLAQQARSHDQVACFSLIRKQPRVGSPVQNSGTSRGNQSAVHHGQRTSIGCKPVRNLTVIFHIKHRQVRILSRLDRPFSILYPKRTCAVDRGGGHDLCRRHFHVRARQRHDKWHAGGRRTTWIVIGCQRHGNPRIDEFARCRVFLQS
jgi:tRNA threonylcarbamoyladenosine biosynthesis protein TsaB